MILRLQASQEGTPVADSAIHKPNSLFTCQPQALWLRSLLLAWLSSAARAADESLVTVENKIGAFDDRVPTGQFNPVSFLVDNRSKDPIFKQAWRSVDTLINEVLSPVPVSPAGSDHNRPLPGHCGRTIVRG